LKDDSDLFFTKYYLAQNYLRNSDLENFNQTATNLLKYLSNSCWTYLLLNLLQSLEELLNTKANSPIDLINCHLELLIHKPEAPQLKQSRIESILAGIQLLEKDFTFKKINPRDFIQIDVNLLSSSCSYYENVEVEVKMAFKCKSLSNLFTVLQIEFNDKNYNQKISVDEMIVEKNVWKHKFNLKFGSIVSGDILSIECIDLLYVKT